MGVSLRDYDAGFVAKLGGMVSGSQMRVTVPGVTQPVPVTFALPEEWAKQWSLPGINVTRLSIVPDASRQVQSQQLRMERGLNASGQDVWSIEVERPKPVNILYQVDMAAESTAEMNALLEHMLFRMPAFGFGTSLDVQGNSIPFRASSMVNLTKDRDSEKGREFRWAYTYVVEAWLTSDQCREVRPILVVDATVHPVPRGQSFVAATQEIDAAS